MKAPILFVLYLCLSTIGFAQNNGKYSFYIDFTQSNQAMVWQKQMTFPLEKFAKPAVCFDFGLERNFDLSKRHNPWQLTLGLAAIYNRVQYHPQKDRMEIDPNFGMVHLGDVNYTEQWYVGLSLGIRKIFEIPGTKKWTWTTSLRNGFYYGVVQKMNENYPSSSGTFNSDIPASNYFLNQLQGTVGLQYHFQKQRVKTIELFFPFNLYLRNNSAVNVFYNIGFAGVRVGI